MLLCPHLFNSLLVTEHQIVMSSAGALTLASVLLYPRTLGGGAVFSGWVPFNSSVIERITPEAKKVPSNVLILFGL